jgi:PhoPQ-activated pathogenicity-related protein
MPNTDDDVFLSPDSATTTTSQAPVGRAAFIRRSNSHYASNLSTVQEELSLLSSQKSAVPLPSIEVTDECDSVVVVTKQPQRRKWGVGVKSQKFSRRLSRIGRRPSNAGMRKQLAMDQEEVDEDEVVVLREGSM